MENNFEEIAAFLDDLGTEIQQVTTSTLQDLANTIPNELRSQIFAEKTNRRGARGLWGSISAEVRDNKLAFGMKLYGYYQVFGVTGKSGGVTSLGIPQYVGEAMDPKARAGYQYKFRKINNSGIEPVRSAAKTLGDIADLIVEALTE